MLRTAAGINYVQLLEYCRAAGRPAAAQCACSSAVNQHEVGWGTARLLWADSNCCFFKLSRVLVRLSLYQMHGPVITTAGLQHGGQL